MALFLEPRLAGGGLGLTPAPFGDALAPDETGATGGIEIFAQDLHLRDVGVIVGGGDFFVNCRFGFGGFLGVDEVVLDEAAVLEKVHAELGVVVADAAGGVALVPRGGGVTGGGGVIDRRRGGGA